VAQKVAVPKNGTNPNFGAEAGRQGGGRRTAPIRNFGMNMPMMSSAFDTAMWLNAALNREGWLADRLIDGASCRKVRLLFGFGGDAACGAA
jgi:hypothetical protein